MSETNTKASRFASFLKGVGEVALQATEIHAKQAARRHIRSQSTPDGLKAALADALAGLEMAPRYRSGLSDQEKELHQQLLTFLGDAPRRREAAPSQ